MRRRWLWALQVLVAAIVVALVARALRRHWSEFTALDLALDVNVGWIALSALAVALVYAILIESWRRILAGWGQHLPYGRAARIWFLANLGRYVPGKVWSVAGLVVLAQRAGVQGWAAAASAFAMQALGLSTAVALVAAARPAGGGALASLGLAAAALAAVATIAVLASERALRPVRNLIGPLRDLRPLPVGAVLSGGALTLLGWGLYGTAFWLLARGLGLPSTLTLPAAAGVFALGYILGLLALFAPGGVGVREAVYIALLTPALGSGGAVALSLASRLLLTLTEGAAGLGALLTAGRSKEDVVEPPQS